MIPSTLCALAALLSSLAAVNGAAFNPRDGTFTYMTPQPTLGGQVTTTSGTTTSSSSTSTSATTTSSSSASTSATVPTTTPTTSSTATRPTTTTTSPTTTSPTTTATSPTTTSPTTTTTPSTSTSPTTTGTTSVPIPITTKTVPTITKTVPITTPTVTTTPTPTPGTVNCNGAQQWQAAFAYTAGNQVIFNNQLYTAKQWTYNNAPPLHPDQWTLAGTCTQPVSNQVNCAGMPAWENNVAYNAGNQVTNQGHLWSAVQWSFANVPGDASGSWKDLGACA